MNQPEINSVLWRLAHFEPNSRDDYGNQLLDYLVLDGLSTYGSNLPISLEFLQIYIGQTYHLAFDIEEIKSCCITLGEKGLVSVSKFHKNELPTITITEDINTKITENLESFKNLEEKVFTDWITELTLRYGKNENIRRHINKIVGFFKSFLSKL